MRRIPVLVGSVATGFELTGIFRGGLAHPAIQYETRPVRNTVSELNRELQEGNVHLTINGPSGYL
jgi:hypothetical protein